MCVCLNILAKFVPPPGGTLQFSELKQAVGHSEGILFHHHPLDLHVKQLFILEAAGIREKEEGYPLNT